MSLPKSIVMTATLLCTALVLGGCGSSGSTAGAGTTAPGAGGTRAPAATAGTSAAPASVRGAVTKAYAEFFGYKTPASVAEKYLQHGSVFAKTLAAQAEQGLQQRLTARVTKVSMLSPDTAAVTFTLLGNGKPLLPNASGNAVREGGTWKVAAKTFCGLLQLQSTPPKACSDPRVTALPG